MGNWVLEVGKMAMYVSFPVTLFYYFNQPQLFEETVIKTKRLIYPREDNADAEQLSAFIKEYQKKHQLEMLADMEKRIK